MKHLFTPILLLMAMTAWSQEVVIKGKITDEASGEPLPGATIQLQGTTYGTITDLNGEFVFRTEPGNKTFLIRYIGYDDLATDLDVTADSFLEIPLSTFNTQLPEVVINGPLQGQQKALNQQKNAPNIKNIVAADQIGRFPDPNVAEAIQRIPGATLQRDQGEGRYVIIRGLAPEFTNISINGEQIPSPEAGVRFVALDAVPADQLSSIEVAKTLTPDMDGDAVGGSVNLVTRRAKGGKEEIQGSLVGGYNELMGKANGQGSFLYGKRFGKSDQLGFLVNGSHYYTDRGSDNWERDGDDIELRDYELRRTRSAISGTIDYSFNQNNEIYFRGIYNSFTDREWRRRYVFVPNVDNSPFEDHEIERLTKDRFEQQDITSLNFGGKHTFTGFTLDYEGSYAKAIQDTPFDYEVNFIGQPDELTTNFSNQAYPSFQTDGDFDYLDNSNYEFDELEAGNTLAEDRNITGKVNLSVPYKIGKNSGLIKAGGKYRSKTKSLKVVNNVYEWAGDEVDFNGQSGDFTAEKFEGGLVDKDFLDGKYTISAAPDMEKIIDFFNANQSGFELSVEDKLVDEAVESYEASEDVLAAYLMTNITFGKLQALVGARFEQTQVEYDYNTVLFDEEGDLDEIVAESGSTDYSYILPQVNLRYSLTKFTNLRAAATASYARPNFQSIVPSQEINLADREGTIGNPELEPVSAVNLDFMVDHYFGTVGVLSLGVFNKQLDNFIYKRRFEADTYNGQNFNTTVDLIQDVNGESASLTGVELAYQQNLTFLPGILSGIGIYANYTFTASNAELTDRSGLGETEKIDLPGQAKHVGNFSLAYSFKGFTARVSANYAGSYIEELGEEADEDYFRKERLQLDASANYQLNDNFNVFAEFINLTNAPFEAYLGEDDSQVIQREFYSWWSRIGVKFNF